MKKLLERFASLLSRNKNFGKSKRIKVLFQPEIETLILSSKTHIEVADEYEIRPRTLQRWLKREELTIPRGRINPHHLRIIYQTFGIPKKLKKV